MDRTIEKRQRQALTKALEDDPTGAIAAFVEAMTLRTDTGSMQAGYFASRCLRAITEGEHENQTPQRPRAIRPTVISVTDANLISLWRGTTSAPTRAPTETLEGDPRSATRVIKGTKR